MQMHANEVAVHVVISSHCVHSAGMLIAAKGLQQRAAERDKKQNHKYTKRSPEHVRPRMSPSFAHSAVDVYQ